MIIIRDAFTFNKLIIKKMKHVIEEQHRAQQSNNEIGMEARINSTGA